MLCINNVEKLTSGICLKPISPKTKLRTLPQTFNIDIPFELADEIEKCKDNCDAFQVGIEWCVQQSKELKQAGVPVLHYFTLGKSDNLRQIAKQVL